MDRQKDALYYTGLLKMKKVSPEELIVDAFKKIDRENPRYNAVVHTRREKALHEARTRDFGNTLFGGVPILIKDLGQDLGRGAVDIRLAVAEGLCRSPHQSFYRSN